MKKALSGFILIFLFFPILISATDWHVRPAGGNYSAEDGSSYENAWKGLENVIWGSGGVEPGDTLYVCGTHIYTSPGGVPASLNIASGVSGNHITIRGDCAGDAGIIWGAGYSNKSPWQDQGNGTYYSVDTGSTNHVKWGVFEDPSDASATLLLPASSVHDCKDNAGTFYTNGSRAMYVHRNDGADPTNSVAIGRIGYRLGTTGDSYLTFRNIMMIAIEEGLNFHNSEHDITIDGCTIKWNEAAGVSYGAGTNVHNMIVNNCTISYCREGILALSGPNGLYNFEWANNTIHHCGYPAEWFPSGDRHCMGTQDSSSGIVSGNELYACQHGLVFYANNQDQIITNITVKNNYIHDMNPGTYGISFRGDTDNAGQNKDNKIYHNIVTNCEMGIFVKYGYNIDVFNNVIYNCNWAIDAAGIPGQPDSPKVTFNNNIVLNSSTYHFRVVTPYSEGHYLINADYNLYYPDFGNQFYLDDTDQSPTTTNFAGWQAITKSGSIFDPHSIVVDPLFVDPANDDFRLQPGSPAIDMGIDVGLTQDFEGNSVPQGAGPDIGAYEFDSGVVNCSVEGDLNNDCVVDIQDLTIVATNFGLTSSFDSRADTDNDGEIDIFDIVFVASRFT